ncbi:MAG: hypothetical protein AUI36_41545 [Cyanobacteria bacterium 13_1_40CM_2_61_4]|nr:MAG: hypothetical protein AUI36_41545 [Cyanobacteria bacterium 13_1_40CM_2_61_4]
MIEDNQTRFMNSIQHLEEYCSKILRRANVWQRLAQGFKERCSQVYHRHGRIDLEPERFSLEWFLTGLTLLLSIARDKSRKCRFAYSGKACQYKCRCICPSEFRIDVQNRTWALLNTLGMCWWR